MPIEFSGIILFSVAELSEKFDMQAATIRNYIRKDKLKGQKIGGKWYVEDTKIREFLFKKDENPINNKKNT